jgi:hypothetical protein
MIPGALFSHHTSPAREAAIAQADAAEREALRKLAELRAAFEGQEHPKFEAVALPLPPQHSTTHTDGNRATRRARMRRR